MNDSIAIVLKEFHCLPDDLYDRRRRRLCVPWIYEDPAVLVPSRTRRIKFKGQYEYFRRSSASERRYPVGMKGKGIGRED